MPPCTIPGAPWKLSGKTWRASSRWPVSVQEEVVYLVDAHDRRGIGLRPADGGAHSYYDVGIEHLAFEVESRDEVDAAHERCVARGARIHFPPEEDQDIDGYYAFFVFDPDGMRIEILCWPREDGQPF